jgi:hypothetical protein
MNNYKPLITTDGFTTNKNSVKNILNNNIIIDYEPIQDKQPFNVEINENLKKDYKYSIQQLFKKFCSYNNFYKLLLKKLIMFMTHLSLISIFEIFFFFSIVSIYENKAITEIIATFFSKITKKCNDLNNFQKEEITYIFNALINTTLINKNAYLSKKQRLEFNNNLYKNAWIYFIIIFSIDLILLLIKFFYKIKINLYKILIENLFMIIILAIYEYMFFKIIILPYQNISHDELLHLIINYFNNCLIKN